MNNQSAINLDALESLEPAPRLWADMEAAKWLLADAIQQSMKAGMSPYLATNLRLAMEHLGRLQDIAEMKDLKS